MTKYNSAINGFAAGTWAVVAFHSGDTLSWVVVVLFAVAAVVWAR